ncbi:hypothetical protein FACS1894188_06740 [Clostridia bacterium]|nr:hypothetical protein FACS1894188_06740 [Clostridia bacterium]
MNISYDDEPATITALDQFITDSMYMFDFSKERRHHEIYLANPRKTATVKMLLVIK